MNSFSISIVFIFLLASPIITAQSTSSSSDYRNDLFKVVEHTRRMLKTSNKRAVANWVTNVVDDRLLNSNSEEIFTAGSPLNFFSGTYNFASRSRGIANMRNDPRYNTIEGKAKLAWDNKLGNCGENSYLTYYILKQAGAPGHVRILETGDDGAHSFTVWDMPASADPNEPKTWGDGLVVDAWIGKVLDGKEAQENRWIKNGDDDIKINDATAKHDAEAESWNTIWREEMRRTGQTGRSHNSLDAELEDCFIATAVYGTPVNAQINTLRAYRDQVLRKTFYGRWFISGYETFGPLAAFYIRHDESRKQWARKRIVEPALKIAKEKTSSL